RRPQMLNASEVPGTKLTRLRLLEVLNGPQLDFERVQQVLKEDVALLARLLKYLNSAAFGWASEVKTVNEAMARLGERPFRKWAAVVALASLGDGKPTELVVTSLAR